MKTIGLIGGMSPESTMLYYKIINQEVGHILGGHHSAQIILASLNFDTIAKGMHRGDWDMIANLMISAVKKLEACQVDVVGICCNSAHKMFNRVYNCTTLPIFHILDPICEKIHELGIKKVAILGNRFVMEDHFYADYLKSRCNIETVIPNLSDRMIIHDIIYSKLCKSIVDQDSVNKISIIISRLSLQGVEAVILGCTELPLLFEQYQSEVLLLNSSRLHALKLVDVIIHGEKIQDNSYKYIASNELFSVSA